MVRKIVPAVLLALASTGASAAQGLNLGPTLDRLTANTPLLSTVITPLSVNVPGLGPLPGVLLASPVNLPIVSRTAQTLVGMGYRSVTTVVIPLVRPIDERIPLPVLGSILQNGIGH
jgi:hypothetical protein